MSKLDSYLEVMTELFEVQLLNDDNAEDDVMDRLDTLWYDMTVAEKEQANQLAKRLYDELEAKRTESRTRTVH